MNDKVILFDADGVLIKSQRQFTDRLEEEYGIQAEKLQPFFTGIFSDCRLGKADLKEELAKVIGTWGWKGTVDGLLQFWFSKGTEIDEEVASFIRELRQTGVRTFLATDQEKYRGEHLRQTLGGGKLFEEVFFSAEVGCPKKDPAFFEHVYQAISDVPRDQILFVDDGEKNIETAKQFGFAVFLFTELSGLKDYLAK